jgi:preprotein translocase subunit SecB
MPLEKAPLASTVAAPQAELGVVTRRIELIDLRMLRGFCNLLVPVQPKLPPTVTQSINIVARLGDEPNRSHTGVTVSFSIVGNYDNGAEGLRVEATFGVLYAVDWIDEPTQQAVDLVGQSVGVNNAWPYWREFVQSMTGRMAIPPLHIPILRMDQLAFTQSEQNKETAAVRAPKPRKKIARRSTTGR